MKRLIVLLLVSLAVAPLLLTTAQAANEGVADVVPGRYIVVLEEGASPAAVAADHSLARIHTYRAALNGFAAVIPERALSAVARDPRVAFVEPDRAYTVADQTTPTGIDRIEGDKIHTSKGQPVSVDKDVAIIDTGVNFHDDLNLAGGRNFAGGPASKWNDGYGHGTHVAGTVGALDNGIGVVGVAPGARVWAIRVCNNGGICFTSNMIAGIDWVTGLKNESNGGSGDGDPGIDFAAANMSLGTSNNATPCDEPSTDALRNAVCGLVASGVPLALAAGNESTTKVAYEAAIAVSAMADFDGQGGGAATATCRSDEDDTLANFSNFGSTIDIAAPGVCILSTLAGGGYGLGSGTSMAAPHVAGAVALYLQANGLSPATDRAGADAIGGAIIGAALPQGHECSYTNERGSDEPLLFVNNAIAFGGDGSCDVAEQLADDVAVTAVRAPSSVTQGDTVSIDVTVENQGTNSETFDVKLTDTTDNVTIGVQSVTLGDGASTTVSFAWDTASATLGDHTLQAEAILGTDEDPVDNSKTTVVTVEEPGNGEKCPPGWQRLGRC